MRKRRLSLSPTLPALLSLISLTAPTARAQSTAPAPTATHFLELLTKQNFTTAFSQFTPQMQKALPEPKLRQAWQSIVEQVGPFKNPVSTKTQNNTTTITCQFTRGKLDVKITLDPQSKVAGLFFAPADLSDLSKNPPPYANPSAYTEKSVTIGTPQWPLPGTLTLPTTPPSAPGPYPAVVLIHGSGPNDRDESIGACRPFRDLALGLASKGIAVLRYDKRTKVHGPEFLKAGDGTFTVQQEIIDDAILALSQLRTTENIDPKRIFLLGHSLGGTVAPRIAQAAPQIAGLIILAGSTRPLEDMIVEQTRYLLTLDGPLTPTAQTQLAAVEATAASIRKLTPADASSPTLIMGCPARYWLDLRAHNPPAEAQKLPQPLLILQGGRDYQVTEVDFNAWQSALTPKPNATCKLYPKLNHLFVPGESKSSPAEYEEPNYVAEPVITDIATWILHPNHERE